jgi:hypothetical protein
MSMSGLAKIPMGEHWAILRQESVFIPGDERSRTAPGHGYPERTEYYISYEAFTDFKLFEGKLRLEMSRASYDITRVRAIHVTETFVRDISVAIKPA